MAKKTTMTCGMCGRDLALANFYKSSSSLFLNGKANTCKECIKGIVSYEDMQTIYTVLQAIDIPFLYSLWVNCEKKKEEKERDGKTYDVFGNYIRQINSLPNYERLRFKDSEYEAKQISLPKNPDSAKKTEYVLFDRDSLLYKWGEGYEDEELKAFERKYEFLKDNYPQITAMHTEALLIYIRYRVKEEFATASGDISQAEKWGKLADKASERAKINPSQLSKADLTGGLNSFGEVVRAVEKAKDIVPILPRFVEKPQDKVDFTLWCYINYARRMKNLPDVEYKEIYRFYEERKNEYKKEDDREFEFEDEKS